MDFSIIQLGNTEFGFQTLRDFLVKIDKHYIPAISNRVDVHEYSLKLLRNGEVFCVINNIGEYIGLLAMYTNNKITNEAFISSIGVLPEYQGKNIASKLMSKAFQLASTHEMKSVLLEVNLNNHRAIHFYKKHGFYEKDRTSDSLFMKIDLPKTQEAISPLVSISCLTYNHASYISECLESLLMQKTTFPIEILIHDDASTDDTVQIVKEYEKKYPDTIFPIYQTQNQYTKGIEISQTYQFSRARGKYIALCEGDDFWTDPLKLQKQVDFLESNQQYSGTSHQSFIIFDEDINKESILFSKHNLTEIDTQHLLEGRLFHTASLMYRAEITKKNFLPSGITASDRALFFLIAAHGKIYYSPEIMCCYRKHEGGMSNWVTTEMLEKDLKIVRWILKVNPAFPKYQYYQFLHSIALKYPNTLSIFSILKHSLLYIYYTFFVSENIFQDLKIFIKQDIPSFFEKVKL